MADEGTGFRYYPRQLTSNPSAQRFMFATGIECSYPMIASPQGGEERRDQMLECGHYDRWREDFELTREVGCRYLRYGLPYHTIHRGPGSYDWSFADEVMPAMRELRITPILDLCHFGVPAWLGNFQNPDYPHHFAEYARAVAERFPWVRFYTPINEMYITAEFSGYYGWWNERLATHEGFVGALKHCVGAGLRAMLEIIQVRPDALFVLCESSEHTHARDPLLAEEAEMFNERRFLTLDLTCGQHVNAGMYAYLRDHGVSEQEYAFFLRHDLREHFIIGHDYYATNERLLVAPERREGSPATLGYYALGRQYHDRYHLPVMHTETNETEPKAEGWLWRNWADIQELRRDGVPVCGMTWYSLTDQIDWDVALRERNNRVNALGLYDLNRKIRPVGAAYKELIRQWNETPLFPNGPFTLVGY